MNCQEMADAQRAGFALARAMGTNATSARTAAIDDVAGMNWDELCRALLGTVAMTAFVVQQSGMTWDDLEAEMERRLAS